jgi:hypothetical protein
MEDEMGKAWGRSGMFNKFWLGNLRGRLIIVGGRLILKLTKKNCMWMWSGFVWLWIGSSSRFL